MPTPIVIKYPFDPSGTATSNLIVGEEHLVPATRNRAFALEAGPFYSESVVVRTMPGNVTLTKNVDYRTLYLYSDATIKTGKEVNAVIHVINPAITGTVSVTYQVVGGNYSTNYDAIQLLLEQLAVDNRSVRFSDLIDAPVAYPPAPHLHHVGNMYGWDAVVQVLEDIRDINLGGGTNATGVVALRHLVLGASGPLSRNRQYLAVASGTFTLPDTATLDVGDTIVVERSFAAVVTYALNNPATESIQVRDQIVDTVGHTAVTAMKFVYKGGFTWECLV